MTRTVTLLGRSAFAVRADVTVASDVKAMVAAAVDRFGGLDVLVNNAGIEKHAPFWDVSEGDFDAVLNVNLKGVFFSAQAFRRDRELALEAGATAYLTKPDDLFEIVSTVNSILSGRADGAAPAPRRKSGSLD